MTITTKTVSLLAIDASAIALSACGKKKSEEVSFIDPNEIQIAPIMHESLTDEQMQRIKGIYDAFDGIDGQPIEKWIEDFKRDLDPNPNITIWENMATAYEAYLKSKKLTKEQKWDVYRVLLVRSMVPEREVLSRLELTAISPKEAVDVMSHYTWKAEPIPVVEIK